MKANTWRWSGRRPGPLCRGSRYRGGPRRRQCGPGEGPLQLRAQHRHRVPDPGRPDRPPDPRREEREGPGLRSPRGQTDPHHDQGPGKGRRPAEIPAELSAPTSKQQSGKLTDAGVIDEVKKIASRSRSRQQPPPLTPPAIKRAQLLMDIGEFFVTRSLLGWPGTIHKSSSFCVHCRTR